MIAIDTQLLVYAHREDSAHHDGALDVLRNLAAGRAPWAVPWPCVHEFLAVVTHPRIYQRPTSMPVALDAMRSVLALPHVHPLAETADYLEILSELLGSSTATGAKVHEARIAALSSAHGVSELWSVDRDFSWFPALRVVNPLAG